MSVPWPNTPKWTGRRVYVPNLEQKLHYRNEKHHVRRSGLCLAFEAQRWQQESQEIQWWKKKTCKNWLGETWSGLQTFIKYPFLCNMQSSSPPPSSFQSEISWDRCGIYELTIEQSRGRATTTQSKKRKNRRKQTPVLSLLTKYGLSTSSCYRAPASISEVGCFLTRGHPTGLDPNTSHGFPVTGCLGDLYYCWAHSGR